MAARNFDLAVFGGLVTALDSRLIPDNAAQAYLNFDVTDGSLRIRYGYRQIAAAQGSFVAGWGLEYLRGFTSTGTEKEEYVSFENISGTTKPYSVDATSGARTEIKNGTTALALNASSWRGIVFNDQSYFFNPNQANSVARHATGDVTSWTELVPPSAPTAPTFTTAAIPSVSGTGWTSATVTGTGNYSSTTNNGSSLDFFHTVGVGVPSSVLINIAPSTMGIQDMTYNDIVEFTVTTADTTGFVIDPTSYQIELLNNDATPLTFTTTAVYTYLTNGPAGGAVNLVNIIQGYWDNKFGDFELGLTQVRLATQAALASNVYANGTLGVGATLTASANGMLANIDSVTPNLGDRILVKNEVTQANNGVYVVTSLGSGASKYVLTRAVDADQAADYTTTKRVYPTAGTVSTNLVYDCGATTVVVGTTALVFTVEGSPDQRGRHYYADIAKIRLKYTVTARSSTSSNNKLSLSLPRYRRADTVNAWGLNKLSLQLGYTLYISATDFESDISTVTVPRASFISIRTGDTGSSGGTGTGTGTTPPVGIGQGNIVTLGLNTTNPSGADKFRIYYKATDGVWHRLGEQLSSVTTFALGFSDPEVLSVANSPALVPFTFKIDNCISAATFKGAWAIWGYRGGFQNVRHSRIGLPINQASSTDLTTDITRGATFGLFGDDPVAIVEAGDNVVIGGNRGIYAQSDTDGTPAGMTPIKRVPKAKAIANQFCMVRWADPTGNPSVVWLTPQGEIWHLNCQQQLTGDTGELLEEIGIQVRSYLESVRVLQSLSDYSTARMAVDEATDSLRIYLGQYALILSRPRPTDNQRQWMPMKYAGTISYVAFSTQRRMRWLRGTGEFDESDWNSNTNAYIQGTNRDGGSAMPSNSIYWQSKTLTYDEPFRINNVYLERGTYTDTQSIQIVSSRQSCTLTLTTGRRFVRFPALQQGREHSFRIIGTEGNDAIFRLTPELFGPIGSREAN